MMAKMKYSEIPRDLSSDSMAAFRLAQVNSQLTHSKLLKRCVIVKGQTIE